MPNRRNLSFDPAVTIDLKPDEFEATPPPSVQANDEPAPRPAALPPTTLPPAAQIDGLAGLAMLIVMVTGLGLPLSGGHLAVDAILVLTGYQLGLGIHRLADRSRTWVPRFWLSAIGPIAFPTVVAVVLVAAAWWWADRLGPAEIRGAVAALAMVANIIPLVADAGSPATDHLWLISLVVQFALLSPLAMVLYQRKRGTRLLTRTVIALVAVVVTTRLTLLVQGVSTDSLPDLAIATRLDGLLLGLGVALAARSMLDRMPRSAAAPSFAALLLVFALAPSPETWPTFTLGLLAPLVALTTAAIVADRAATSGSDALSRLLANLGLRWLGERAITIYVWHQLFGMALTGHDGNADLFGPDWPGVTLFITQLVFALAAGAATFRYLQVPVRSLAWRVLSGDRPMLDPDQRQQHPGDGTLPLTA